MGELIPDITFTDADAIEAAARLSERQRVAFFLVQVRGLSYRDAARVMGGSSSNVYKTYKRACVNIALDLLDSAQKRG